MKSRVLSGINARKYCESKNGEVVLCIYSALEKQYHLLHECVVISFPQCYTNLKSYIILSEVSSYAQN